MAILLSTGACSFAFVHGPPPDHVQREYFFCTDSRTVPVMDAVGAIVWSAIGFAAAAVAFPAAWVFLGAGGLSGVGSFAGFENVSRCREAWEARAIGREVPDIMPASPRLGPVDTTKWSTRRSSSEGW